jgi:beta-lactamase regulating signal transducer with metallopeptidase domain
MLNNIFTEILNMSISAGIIAVVVILLRLIMKNRINKTLILLFWAIVFIKLVLPFELPSPTSVFNALPNTNITHSVDNFILNPQNNIQTLNRGINTSVVARTDSEIIKSYSTAKPATTPIKAVSFADVMPFIWFCGALLLFLFFFCNYIAVHLRFNEAVMIKNNFVEEFIKQYNLKRKVRVLKSTTVKSPVVFGVLRPKIILPYDFDLENETTLKHILTHEMQHIKRFDNLTNLIVLLLLCLHWFNPIVWLSKVLLSKDIEAACDEGTLRKLGEQSKCEYAESLLRIAQHNRKFSPAFFVSFGESNVKSRIKAILKYKKITVASIVITIIFLVVLIASCATKALSNETKNVKLSSSSNQVSSILSNNSSSIPAQQTIDIFMKYVNDHGYIVQTNSGSGGPIKLSNFYNVKSTDKINVILNNAYESSKKLGFDFLPYQGKPVIFRTCGIESGNEVRAEANCFTDNNKIIGFWISTLPANADKTEDESGIILASLSTNNVTLTKTPFSQSTVNSSLSQSAYSIFNVDFISSNIGYLCLRIYGSSDNASYKLIKTTDGGIHWTLVGNINHLISTSFIDTKTGYGILDSGNPQTSLQYTLVKTVDGGVSWNPVDFLTDKKIEVIKVVNKDVMFVGTVDSMIYRTVDGGKNWMQINMPTDDRDSLRDSNNISWVSSNEGYVLYENQGGTGGTVKTLYYTNNAGITWSIKSRVGMPIENPFKDIGDLPLSGFGNGMKFFSNGVGYIGLHRGATIKSTDGGVHFSSVSDYDETGIAPDFINSKEGYVVIAGALNHTVNSGVTWTKINIGLN